MKTRSRTKTPSPKRQRRQRRAGQASIEDSTIAGTSHSTAAGQNIFEDLGFPIDEAENLRLRAQLMVALRGIINGLSQAEAAALLEVSQPRISHLTRGKISLFTIDTLVNMLAAAGARVRVTVQKKR